MIAAEKPGYVADIVFQHHVGGKQPEVKAQFFGKVGSPLDVEFQGGQDCVVRVKVTPHAKGGVTQYQGAFEIKQRDKTIAAPTLLIEAGKTGTIALGKEGAETLRIDFKIREE